MPGTAGAGAAEDRPWLDLEFVLDPAAAPRLARHPAIGAARAGRTRGTAEELIWLDTPDGALAAAGLVAEAPRRGPRRLLRVLPEEGEAWIPGTPPAAAPEEAAPAGEATMPVAAFSGRRLLIPLAAPSGPVQLELRSGRLRAVAAERPAARLRLSGAPEAVLALARALAADLPLLPGPALAEEGRALARGEAPRPRRAGPPEIGGAATVEAALAGAAGHLLEVLLHQAPLCRPEAGPEGVHQMRVALRRLRSVLRAFRPAARCPAVAAFEAGLRDLAATLGAARDLDVFLEGLGARVTAGFPGDRRIAALLKAMEARRLLAYRTLRRTLEGPGFRVLALDGIALLLCRPWREAAAEAPKQAALLEAAPPDFAARVLDRRWRRLRAEGEEIRALTPEALHALRLTGKRLRYAAELFAPLWPGKPARRFLKRLAALQEALGTVNDAAVARSLVGSLGSSVPAWAVGAVEGFALARAGRARKRAHAAWDALLPLDPFWRAG
ncbi:CYTH and CHAD domain-containing protein [Crenalkalicoccus roseus]|uniref:CYTH and CHAD domain-containing protein n=1 Tax=Crenalkalicoccus roseus TaxID=1485588 RepID=UPI001082010B|nr:CHAD domain-containing protein [Crenalkalicoccus roseus]